MKRTSKKELVDMMLDNVADDLETGADHVGYCLKCLMRDSSL